MRCSHRVEQGQCHGSGIVIIAAEQRIHYGRAVPDDRTSPQSQAVAKLGSTSRAAPAQWCAPPVGMVAATETGVRKGTKLDSANLRP